MKMTIVWMLIFSWALAAYGQGSEGEDGKPGISLSVQVDAFDFIAKGFSGWIATTFDKNRVFLVGGMNELPDFLNPLQENFGERRRFFFQGGYCRFLRQPVGLFVGGELIYQQMEITQKSTGTQLGNGVLRAGPVVGYEWLPFKKRKRILLTPWASIRLPLHSPEVVFSNPEGTYKTSDFNFVMGFNLGYRIWGPEIRR